AAVDDLAIGLIRAGIVKGDRVGMWAPNCAEWTITQYATAKIGAILVSINPAYRTHELAYVLKQAGVKLLVSATEFKTSDYRAMVEEVVEEVVEETPLERVLFLGTPGWDEA
ncbi:AMP-binding protein, partial [Nocardioides sp. GCM10030258]